MIWIKIGDKWFDSWISKVMDLHSSLDSCACDSSPLTSKEREDLSKAFEKINKINLRISKRLNRKDKKK